MGIVSRTPSFLAICCQSGVNAMTASRVPCENQKDPKHMSRCWFLSKEREQREEMRPTG